MRARSPSICDGTFITIVSRQSALVTSNQNVARASLQFVGGIVSCQSALKFHKYCAAPAAAHAVAISSTRGENAARQPPGVETSTKSAHPGTRRIIVKWLPKLSANTMQK